MREYTIKCDHCQQDFPCSAVKWKKTNYERKRFKRIFCSKQCRLKALNQRESIKTNCTQCGQSCFKKYKDYKKTKNHFCSHSCSATFNNKNKTHGARRSKLEKYLEKELIKIFPELEFHFNRKDAISSELDIFIPNLKLAFELNGIFHYEPIYGQEKLSQIQNNDGRKFQACLEKQIELCIIDTSSLSYFKETSAKKFLDIITHLVNQRLSRTDCVEVV